jgi:hypothetical protein
MAEIIRAVGQNDPVAAGSVFRTGEEFFLASEKDLWERRGAAKIVNS